MSAFDPRGLFAPEAAPAAEPGGDPIVARMRAERLGLAKPPEPEPDPIVAQMREERRKANETQTNLVRWRAANEKASPEERANVLRYSAASGLAPEFVQENLEDVRRQVDAAQVNWAEVAQRQPVLLKYLLDDPSVQPLVKDDVAKLSGIEWALTAPFHALTDAIREQGTIARQFLEAEGLGSEENRKAIEESERLYAGKTYGAETWLEKAWIGIPRLLPFVAGDVAARAAGAVVGAAGAAAAAAPPAAAVGAAATAPAGGAGAVPAAAAAATAAAVPGALTGQFVGSGIYNYAETVGPLYWRLRHVPGVDEATARALAQGGAVVNGVLGSALLGKLSTSLPGAKGLLERLTARTVEKALAQETKTGAVVAFGKRYGETVLTGASLMAAQGAVNQAAEESAKGLSGGEARWANVADATAEGFVTGLQDMTLFAAIGPGRQLLHDVGRARRGAESAARLEALTGAADSKLLERYPEKFRELVVRMKQEGKVVSDVLIPVEAWQKYWAKQKLDPAEVAATVVGDGGKSYAEALQTGGDVRIPVEQYLSKVVRSKHGEALGQDARLFADAPTPRQFSEEAKAVAERMKAEAKRREPELKDGREQVFQAFRDAAVNAGVKKAEAEANATLVSEMAGTLAVRTGLSVPEVAATLGFSRLRILAGPGAAREAVARLEQALRAPEPLGDEISLPIVPIGELPKDLARDERGVPTPDDATRWALKNLRGKYVNEHTGWDIGVGRTGLKKTTWSHIEIAEPRILTELPEMLRTAMYESSEPFRGVEDSGDHVAVHRLYNLVRVDGELHLARLIVREFRDGAKFYRLQAVEIERPASLRKVGEPEGSASFQEPGTVTVATLRALIKSDGHRFRQGSGASLGPRGEMVMHLDPAGRPVSFDVHLLKADRSTLAHETAHVFSLGLGELAEKSEALAKDYGDLVRWMGYDSPEARKAKLDPAKEERLTHAWERYLAEGKAPSKKLEGVFRRFKGWLLKIYRSLPAISRQYEERYGQPLNLNPEVRAIFDRLLAVEEATREHRPESDPAAVEAMTPAERTRYEEAIAKARETVDAETDAAAAEIASQRVGEARIRITGEESSVVDQDPAMRAVRMLRGGELEGRKLNRAATVKQFGADVVRDLPPGLFAAKKGEGMLPGTAAVSLGFEDSRHMVDALRKAPDRDAEIARRVEDRLDREYGPALKLIQEAAMHAAGSNDAARATLMELRALAKQVSPEAAKRVENVSLDLLRETAQALVGDTKLIDLDPAEARRRERSTALRAAELWGKGEREAALDAKEQRLLNQVLFMEARDRKRDLDAARERIRGVSTEKRAQLGKADPEIRNLHDAILGAVGLGEKTQGNLDRGLEVARSWGESIDFDVEQIRGVLDRPRAWDLLTVAEAENLHDAVRNLRQIATHRAEVEIAGKKQDRDALVEEMGKALARRKALPPQAYETTQKTIAERARALGRGADALVSDVETLATLLDAGDRDGPWHRLLIDGRVAARTEEVRLAKGVLEKVTKLWEQVPREIRDLRDQTVDVADLLPSPSPDLVRPPETRATLWMLFLNWGNEGNRQRVRDGNGWSDESVGKALAMLTPEERRFLQGMLDVTDSLYPELARVHEKRTGLQLPKVSAATIDVGGETHRGGYFPLRYDRRFSLPGEKQAAESVEALFGPNYAKPTVSASSRRARVEKVSAPVAMEWGVVPAHFAQVIHDIAYGDYVREVGSVLLDRRVKDLVTQYVGEERGATLIPWLRDVANARADSAAGELDVFSRRAGNFTRRLMANVALAYNVPNQIQGMLDAFRAPMEGVAFHRVADAYVRTMNPATWRNFQPFAESAEIDLRSGRILENMRRQFAEVAPGADGPTLRAIEEAGFHVYALTDAFGSRVTFRAAYGQALAEGKTHKEAVRYGDGVVRKLFPTHDVAEKPPLLRSRRGLGAVLMFHTWANRNYNILRRAAEGENRGAAVATLAARAMYFGLIGAGSAYLIGRGPTEDQDATGWLFTRVALEPLNTLPLAGPLAEKAIAGHRVNVRASPEAEVMVQLVDRVGSLVEKWKKGDATAGEKALATVELVGFGGALAGAPVPLGQIHRTGSYLQQLGDRKQRPRGPLDVVRGVAYGPVRKDRPADPLTDIQDLLAGR